MQPKEGLQQTTELKSPNKSYTNPGQQSAHHSGNGNGVDGLHSNGGKFASWGNFKAWMIKWRGSRQLVLVIVAIALLLDNMLLTVVGKFYAIIIVSLKFSRKLSNSSSLLHFTRKKFYIQYVRSTGNRIKH